MTHLGIPIRHLAYWSSLRTNWSAAWESWTRWEATGGQKRHRVTPAAG